MDIRTQIAPKGLQFKPNSFIASDINPFLYPKNIDSAIIKITITSIIIPILFSFLFIFYKFIISTLSL